LSNDQLARVPCTLCWTGYTSTMALAVGTLASMGMGAAEDRTAAVVTQWRRAGPALAQVRRDELRRLTDAEALAAAEELLDLVRLLPPLTGASGLVEQQRLFARART
jgi:hypothetical protein